MSCLLPETRDFRVRVRIDLIESASCRVDYSGNLADDSRHRVIDVGLFDHRDRLSLTQFMHGVHRSARVISGQTVRELMNRGGVLLKRGGLLGEPIADLRPRVR